MRSSWIFLFWATSIFALPQDPLIVSGDATMVALSTEVLEIVAPDGTMIEWRDFSIGTSETARFSQPSAEALVLNRVIGSEISQIFGKLEANGRVLLINPNGILFGKEARIDTGSFIASTLDLQNDLFAKNKIFKGASTAQIINLGSLNAREGSLALIASDINQQGSLSAQKGLVALIGSTYTQDFECQFPDENGSRITHSGRIDSPGGRIHLMAGEIFVFGTSEITTSHPFSGGEILIGAGQQGKDPSFTNAQWIWVDEGAQLLADSWEQGNGGRVILFSDAMTDFAGHISAQGGKWGGDGGFAEVSGGYLSFRGLADLRSIQGEAGTLLLDPSDITITAAVDAGNTVLLPATFPLNCGLASVVAGIPAGTIISQNQPAGAASSISVVPTLTTQIGLGHIIIDSTGAGAGTGDIFWNPGANFAYLSANDLVLRAPLGATVTIFSNVQNSGTGGTIIDSLGTLVQINRGVNAFLTNTQKVSFGSALGLTQICAPNAVVNIEGTARFAMFEPAQVGFYTPSAGVTTATGPIVIDCLDLNVIASRFEFCGSQVGHGQIDNVGTVNTNTTSTATITVNASRDITMTLLPPFGESSAVIGHGSKGITAGGLNTLAGDINLQIGRDLRMQNVPVAGDTSCRIGHSIGCINMLSISGDICVSASRDITMIWSGIGNLAEMNIGHGNRGLTLATLDGNIEVCCGNDLIITDNTGLGELKIGHAVISGPTASYTGTNRITVGRDLLVTSIVPNVFRNIEIGIDINPTPAGAPPAINFTTQVTCGRNITVNSPQDFFLLGGPRVLVGTIVNAATNVRTLIMAGGDITLNANGQVTAYGDLAIAAGGNLTATPNNGNLFITSQNRPLPGLFSTRIYARGNIIGTNSAGLFVDLGNANQLSTSPNYFVDFRAGEDIQLPFRLDFVGTGGVFIEADTLFTAGQQWTYAGGILTSICGLPAIASPFCCTTPLAGIAAATSPALAPDGIGCFSAVPLPFSPLPVLIQSTSGPITINSAPRSSRIVGDCDFNIGNDVTLTTISGNIQVFGTQIPGQCPRPNSFHNVTINQNICTTGSVLISANNNLTMAPGSSIGGPACGALIPSSVTLICDNQAPIRPLIGLGGTFGGFFMDSTAVINSTGRVLIFTALQNINAINGFINSVNFSLGPLFICSNTEAWCSYFCDVTCPMSGVPFTIAYKNCLQQALQQATIIIDQFLVDLHPYNEYPGWMMRFWLGYEKQVGEDSVTLNSEPYMLRRRHLNIINHPKTWTQQSEDTHPRPLENKTL